MTNKSGDQSHLKKGAQTERPYEKVVIKKKTK